MAEIYNPCRAMLYSKLQQAREDIRKKQINKSGENNFQHFKYFELDDILAIAVPTLLENDLSTRVGIQGKKAFIEAIDLITGYGEKFPLENVELSRKLSTNNNNLLQDVGKKSTYYRRYLYLQLLDIHEYDQVDGEQPQQQQTEPQKTTENKTKYPARKVQNIDVKQLDSQIESSLKDANVPITPENKWNMANNLFQNLKINRDEFKELKHLYKGAN